MCGGGRTKTRNAIHIRITTKTDHNFLLALYGGFLSSHSATIHETERLSANHSLFSRTKLISLLSRLMQSRLYAALEGTAATLCAWIPSRKYRGTSIRFQNDTLSKCALRLRAVICFECPRHSESGCLKWRTHTQMVREMKHTHKWSERRGTIFYVKFSFETMLCVIRT